MIFEFTYTECTSPGPFKKQTGFKVKSARIYEINAESTSLRADFFRSFDTEDQDGNPIQDTLNEVVAHMSELDAATTHLGGFSAPLIGPFSSPEEFAGIPKGFIYDLVQLPERKFAWLLARLSTSGPANGRPGNPFHQGILITSGDSKMLLKVHATQYSKLEYPRPIDFFTWTGWLNPRGDIQVDASNLRSSNLPYPEISAEEISVGHSEFVTRHGDFAIEVFKSVERSFLNSSPVGLPGDESEEFRSWVSVVSHLIPASAAWFCGFGSTWTQPSTSVQNIKLPNKETSLNFPQFYWSKNIQIDFDGDTSWAYLASKVFEYELDMVVYDSINQVDKAFSWSAIDGAMSYALLPLPLAILGLTQEDFGDDGDLVATACAEILERIQWPTNRGDSRAFEALWEMLEAPESLYNSLDDRSHLERKLDALLPLPKESK
jgi:hypothetical protein